MRRATTCSRGEGPRPHRRRLRATRRRRSASGRSRSRRATRSANTSTFRSRASAASASRLAERVARSEARGRCGSPGDGGGRRGGPRRRWNRRRCSRGGGARLLRGGDADDRAARRRTRDLLRRRQRGRPQSRLLRLGAVGRGAPLESMPVRFGDALVDYAIGAASCAVPGLPAGLDALWRAHGRLPWADVVEPALSAARAGVAMTQAHAACLAMLEPVMTMREGAGIYAPGGALLSEGDLLRQPGLVPALELVRDEGVTSVYSGSIASSAARADGRARGARSPPATSPHTGPPGRSPLRPASRGAWCRRGPVSRASPRRSPASIPPAAPTRCSRRSNRTRRSTVTPRTSPSWTARATPACSRPASASGPATGSRDSTCI